MHCPPRRCLMLVAALALFGVAPFASLAEPARITVDGFFDDWRKIEPLHADAAGDTSGGVDFGRIWAAHDENYLFLRLEVGDEILLQQSNALALYLDLDSDPSTGDSVHGLGADAVWRFGKRRGAYLLGEQRLEFAHQQIGLVTLPTMTSDQFEIVIARNALPRPEIWLFAEETFRFAVVDETPGGDRLPDKPGGLSYRFEGEPKEPFEALGLGKLDPAHLRIMAYNINDHLGQDRHDAAIGRLVAGLAPDIIAWQELRSLGAEEAKALVAAMYPSARDWQARKAGGEHLVVVSPFAIESAHPLGDSAAFLLDLRPRHDSSLLLVVLSPPCCNRDPQRQVEYDQIAAFVRDAKLPGGALTLAPETPIVVIGDGNLVGASSQYRTLLDGKLGDEARFGHSVAPDWDGSSLRDPVLRHTHRPLTFTWIGRSFSPGRLDLVAYTDSVVEMAHGFVVFTPHIPAPMLDRHGLLRNDVFDAGDHLPLVVDLNLPLPRSIDE